jgi:hypothetical protein
MRPLGRLHCHGRGDVIPTDDQQLVKADPRVLPVLDSRCLVVSADCAPVREHALGEQTRELERQLDVRPNPDVLHRLSYGLAFQKNIVIGPALPSEYGERHD